MVNGQKIEGIHFHLYTDSLKKGVHNYINVDGKLADGSWYPLSSKEIQFTASYGIFEGNDLVLPDSPTQKTVTIKAVLKSNSAVWKEVTIPIKTKPDNEALKTTKEIMDDIKKESRKKRKDKE